MKVKVLLLGWILVKIKAIKEIFKKLRKLEIEKG